MREKNDGKSISFLWWVFVVLPILIRALPSAEDHILTLVIIFSIHYGNVLGMPMHADPTTMQLLIIASLPSQLDGFRITMETPLYAALFLRKFQGWVKWGGKTYPKCGWHHSKGWWSGLNKKEKAHWVTAFDSPCFLTADATLAICLTPLSSVLLPPWWTVPPDCEPQ